MSFDWEAAEFESEKPLKPEVISSVYVGVSNDICHSPMTKSSRTNL